MKPINNFIQVQERLYDSEHLDIYHMHILSWVQSYNRNSQPFFMSNQLLAQKLKCNTKTIKRRFDDLIEWGLITNIGKRGRSWLRKTDGRKIKDFLQYGPRVHNTDTLRTESPLYMDSESNYNTNNKTSLNKTSLSGEASLNASPSQSEILTCLD